MRPAILRSSPPRAVCVIAGQGPVSNAFDAALQARSTSAASHSGISAQASPGIGIVGLEGLAGRGVAPLAVDVGLERSSASLGCLAWPPPGSGRATCADFDGTRRQQPATVKRRAAQHSQAIATMARCRSRQRRDRRRRAISAAGAQVPSARWPSLPASPAPGRSPAAAGWRAPPAPRPRESSRPGPCGPCRSAHRR